MSEQRPVRRDHYTLTLNIFADGMTEAEMASVVEQLNTVVRVLPPSTVGWCLDVERPVHDRDWHRGRQVATRVAWKCPRCCRRQEAGTPGVEQWYLGARRRVCESCADACQRERYAVQTSQRPYPVPPDRLWLTARVRKVIARWARWRGEKETVA